MTDNRNTILDVPVGILFEDTDLQPPNSLHLTTSIGIILEGQVVLVFKLSHERMRSCCSRINDQGTSQNWVRLIVRNGINLEENAK